MSVTEGADVYVTGSNSRFLSTDVVTEFRGRGDEIHVWPLSFKEFVSVYEGSKEDAWAEYIMFGGLPQLLTQVGDDKKGISCVGFTAPCIFGIYTSATRLT